MHDGCPVACSGDAPFGYVNVFTSHLNVGFFHGAALPDPARLLQGTGKLMRHVKLRPGTATNAGALSGLIDAAYADIEARRRTRLAQRNVLEGVADVSRKIGNALLGRSKASFRWIDKSANSKSNLYQRYATLSDVGFNTTVQPCCVPIL